MQICKHIGYFYIEDRIKYIERIIKEARDYPYTTDIFIHTNVESIPFLETPVYDNGKFQVIYHDLTGLNPYSLTEMPRKMLKTQKDDYDIFMYLEDDILVPKETIMYWLKYNELCIEHQYNIGFLRIETSEKNNKQYITDLYGEKMNTRIEIFGETFCVNDKNPYCAFWIYNKNEFAKFVDSKFYDIKNDTQANLIHRKMISNESFKAPSTETCPDDMWESWKNTFMQNMNDDILEKSKTFKYIWMIFIDHFT